jgi:hypothetical protein
MMSEEKSCSSKPDPIEFRTVAVPDNKSIFSKKIGMIQSFAMSLTSRGLNEKKINKIKPHFTEGGRFEKFRSVFEGFEAFL